MIFGTMYVTGFFCLFLAAAMLVPMIVDLASGHPDWQAFLTASLLVGLVSVLAISATRGRVPPFSLRFGFLLVNALWLATALVGAIPFVAAGLSISFTDAVFESVSGLTTTGSTILSGLDDFPPGLLLWRSLLQWIGGLGIIAMSLLLLPFLRVGGMQIFRLESSTRSENPFPRFVEFSWALVGFYLVISLSCALGYMLAGMDLFEAVNHAMATVSTGGYSTHDASLGYYGPGVHVVAIVFMIAGALPFIAILRAIVTGSLAKALDPQIPVLLAILAVLSLLVTLPAIDSGIEPHLALVHALFNITSVVTTTGFASTDYTLWGPFAITVFFIATFLGGAAGSTSGGFKTYRLIILFKSLANALRELLYPHGLFIVRYDGAEVSPQALRAIATFFAAFIASWLLIGLGLSATGLDFVTAITGSLTALTNVGPGLGDIIGPAGNFASIPDTAKWLLVLAMLLGRLEIITVLVLVSPTFWRGAHFAAP